MNELGRGQELHARACDGEHLSVAEQQELDDWYGEMDREEAGILNIEDANGLTNDDLRAQIDGRMEELRIALGKIQELERNNDAIRTQNEELKKQLIARGILVA